MKIYYIANARFPTERAHGIQLAKMCEALIEQGADLELIVPKRKTVSQTPQQFYGFKKEIRVKKLPVIDCYGSTRLGFIIASATFAISYFFYLLFKKIKDKKAIIYTIDMDQFSFILIPLLGLPYFSEIHDAKKKDFCHRIFFRHISGVIAINQLIKNKLKETFRLPDDKIAVYPNGIDLAQFVPLSIREARHKLNLPLDKYIIIYIGKFYHWKGLEILIPVARDLGEKFLILLVGGTKKQLLELVAEKELPANLFCQGHRDFKEIPFWLAAADALLLLGTQKNQYSFYYTSPMKLFEYMVAQRPIVAAATPAISQVVSEQEVFFYHPDSFKDLVAKIRHVLQNKQESDQKAKFAYQKVQDFSWQKRAQNILQFIEVSGILI